MRDVRIFKNVEKQIEYVANIWCSNRIVNIRNTVYLSNITNSFQITSADEQALKKGTTKQ